MRFRGSIFLSLVAVGFIAAAYFPRPDSAQKEAVLIQVMLKRLADMHYQPQPIDDNFSKKVFNYYLDQLDGGRRYFTQADIDKLKAYELQLDDQAQAGNYDFFNLSSDLFLAGLDKTQGFYREILAQPFDFDAKETVEFDGDKLPFAANDAELKQYWHKYLKYEVLDTYVDKLEDQEKAGADAERKSPEALEKEAREEILKIFEDRDSRLRKLKRDDRLSLYLNCITAVFDPHTNYFKPIDKQNFDIRFSGRLEGIGALLQTDGELTKVSSIVVGGPAWKGKELEADDVILKVAQGNDEPVDIKGMYIDDVVQQVRGAKGTEVRLTVKKKDGSVKVISIIRDIVILEEQFAKSLLLDGKEPGEKVGYIYLPSFYADFENENGRNCAEDVAVEIEKLKSENVNGIILDLRNNGGGSLRDVVRMTGYFIEKGPIVQVKSRNQSPDVMPDNDPGVQYDGPLVVMVNSNSASASEIIAAALQDYNRAVIVGTPTFGKGTVQRFIDLDRSVAMSHSEVKPLGNVKLTMQKFYRINGGSTQLKGVTPDIVMPDAYAFIETGEREEKYPMEWTEIGAVSYNQNVMKIAKLDKIKANSQKRIGADPVFQQITSYAQRVKTQYDQTAYPLQLEAFRDYRKARNEESQAFKDLFKNPVNTGVRNLPVDLTGIEADESKKARNEDWLGSISKDAYLRETLNIMHDLINQKGLSKK
jgi:carboxyl-terminal processing protease